MKKDIDEIIGSIEKTAAKVKQLKKEGVTDPSKIFDLASELTEDLHCVALAVADLSEQTEEVTEPDQMAGYYSSDVNLVFKVMIHLLQASAKSKRYAALMAQYSKYLSGQIVYLPLSIYNEVKEFLKENRGVAGVDDLTLEIFAESFQQTPEELRDAMGIK